mmetsp:Transcript_21747/g.55769  ORF Transcript_21747/g.55769 Transcript_21747/m.55769 type:complete len:407 (-) Transcript_21747:731-1951(-)
MVAALRGGGLLVGAWGRRRRRGVGHGWGWRHRWRDNGQRRRAHGHLGHWRHARARWLRHGHHAWWRVGRCHVHGRRHPRWGRPVRVGMCGAWRHRHQGWWPAHGPAVGQRHMHLRHGAKLQPWVQRHRHRHRHVPQGRSAGRGPGQRTHRHKLAGGGVQRLLGARWSRHWHWRRCCRHLFHVSRGVLRHRRTTPRGLTSIGSLIRRHRLLRWRHDGRWRLRLHRLMHDSTDASRPRRRLRSTITALGCLLPGLRRAALELPGRDGGARLAGLLAVGLLGVAGLAVATHGHAALRSGRLHLRPLLLQSLRNVNHCPRCLLILIRRFNERQCFRLGQNTDRGGDGQRNLLASAARQALCLRGQGGGRRGGGGERAAQLAVLGGAVFVAGGIGEGGRARRKPRLSPHPP